MPHAESFHFFSKKVQSRKVASTQYQKMSPAECILYESVNVNK